MSATDFGDPNHIIRIPARDLTGTREAKLAELDMLLTQLQVVRLVLCGLPVRPETSPEPSGDATCQQRRLWSRGAKGLRAVLNAVRLGPWESGGSRAGIRRRSRP